MQPTRSFCTDCVRRIPLGWAFVFLFAFTAHAEIPPAPTGYDTPDDAKAAVMSGKVAMADFNRDVPETIEVQKGVEYGKGGDVALKLDLYSPKNLVKPAPAVLLIHGGGWKGGSRNAYHSYCVRFAEHGYVAATMSYRLTGVAPFPAAVEDAKCAVRWLRANARRLKIDPNRIAVGGGSAGGHLSMMVGYSPDVAELDGNGGNGDTSSRVQAIINFYGPVDLTTDFAKSKGLVVDFLDGKTFDDAPDQYRLASPITHVTSDDPPTLILHGSIDRVVPIRQADILVAKLKEAGVAFVYDRIEGWPHGMDIAKPVNEHCFQMMLKFLGEHLKKAEE